jgi:hypothetical protein
MNKNSTPLVDDHLQSLQGIQETGTDDFFYTRLKARMQGDEHQQGWSFPLRPVWVIGTLTLLLAVNGFMLSQEFKSSAQNTVHKTKTTTSSSLQNFAESYDQTISSSY